MFKQHWSKLSWTESYFTSPFARHLFSLPKGKLRMSNNNKSNNNFFFLLKAN